MSRREGVQHSCVFFQEFSSLKLGRNFKVHLVQYLQEPWMFCWNIFGGGGSLFLQASSSIVSKLRLPKSCLFIHSLIYQLIPSRSRIVYGTEAPNDLSSIKSQGWTEQHAGRVMGGAVRHPVINYNRCFGRSGMYVKILWASKKNVSDCILWKKTEDTGGTHSQE